MGQSEQSEVVEMTRILLWAGAGVYAPSVDNGLVEWNRDFTNNPIAGVKVNSPQHGQLIADVWVQTGKSRLAILQQMEKVQ